jgi:hypothetical protein
MTRTPPITPIMSPENSEKLERKIKAGKAIKILNREVFLSR